MFGNFLYYTTPFPGWVSVPSSFVSLFIFYIFFYLLSKTIGCFSGHLMSSASDKKLFCAVCSAFKYYFNEFVGEKVVSPSYSSTILAPPQPPFLFISLLFTAICKPFSDSHFAFLHFFSSGMVLITASYTMSQASIHSSSGTLSIRSNPLNLCITSSI